MPSLLIAMMPHQLPADQRMPVTMPGTKALVQDFLQMGGKGELHAPHPELLQLTIDLIEAAVERGEIKQELPADLMGSVALVQLASPVYYWFQHPEVDLHSHIQKAIFQWLYGAKK